MGLNLILSVAPTVVIIFIILRLDHFEKEPRPLLVKLFVAGMFTVIPAVIFENMVPFYETDISSVIGKFFYALLGVALIEESVKYFGAKIFGYSQPSFNEVYDGIIYCVLVALGFATVENILYVFQYGTSVALVRALTAVPAHAIFGVTMGYYMALAKASFRRKGYYHFMSLFMPILIHGIYDTILFLQYDFAMLIFIPYLLFMYFRAIQLIKRTNKIQPFR